MSETTEATTAEKVPSQHALDILKATEIVVPLHEAGKDEEEILSKLLPVFKKYKKSFKLMNLALQNAGFALGSKDRYELAKVVIAEMEAPKTWAEVRGIVVAVADEVKDTSEQQALGCVKKFAKEMEIELPKKPKSEPGEGGARGFRGVAFTWMVQNASASREELAMFIRANDKKETDVTRLCTIFDLCKAVASKLNA
ncbi:hypothetical protein LCGC14_2260670 [marine sediment metagenome]|uniref:Uncharacterized protein n=1 Tax=marine sediment metagenome TaxID=412755 RepID=A0A0F9FUU9_9ZZZZ